MKTFKQFTEQWTPKELLVKVMANMKVYLIELNLRKMLNLKKVNSKGKQVYH